jgi:hypothetical protein
MAFSLYRSDLGYVQGMSYIGASLLLHLEGELETFRVFANLMNREQLMLDFYSFDMPQVELTFKVFGRLLKERVPRLHAVIEESGLSCSVFMFEWVLTLYSNIFPLSLISRLWDSILFFGEFFVIKTALAISACLDSAMDSSSFDNVAFLMKGAKDQVTEASLFNELQKMQLTKSYFLRVKQQVLSENQ